MSATRCFTPYQPSYNRMERVRRWGAIATVLSKTSLTLVKSRLSRTSLPLGASVEITDRCNAGCHYCYVYPEAWSQAERMAGYLQLATGDRANHENRILELLTQLQRDGITYVSLVGGEPLFAPQVIRFAAERFPVVWVVTNGTIPFPAMPRSVVWFVSIDGTPEHHNAIRDPKGLFGGNTYRDLTGMSARIVKHINESERGAYVHITLTRRSLPLFRATVDWLVRDVEKLRGIVVSGAAAASPDAPDALSAIDRLQIKAAIEAAAAVYGWQLFPANQPATNAFLFNPEHIIHSPTECTVARRVASYGYDGDRVGKCVLRDSTDCRTCVCNVSGMTRSVAKGDRATITGLVRSCFG